MSLKKLFRSLFILLLLPAIIGGSFAVPASALSSQKSALVEYFTSEGLTLQEYVDSSLSENAGTTHGDWLFFGLKRLEPTLDHSTYLSALKTKLGDTLSNTDKERIALIFSMCDPKNSFIESALSLDSTSLTVNEAVYALILLDSNAYKSEALDRDRLISRLLSMQLEDGGWALSGTVYDVDVTAMVLQALSPYVHFEDVSHSVSRALSLLSEKQNGNGDYKSRGVPTCESTVQVIIALHSLDIDPRADTRFIKNGNTLYDGLALYQTQAGGYSHTVGASVNGIATAQAACALASAELFEGGKLGFYRFTSTLIPREPHITQEESLSSAVTSHSEASESESASDISSEESSVYSSFSEEEALPGSDLSAKITKSISYKYIACTVVIIIFSAVCIILFIKGRFTLKSILPIAIASFILILLILFVNITSVKEHYSGELTPSTEGSQTVTLTVNASVISDIDESIPDNGYIIPPIEYVISDGSTPFSALLDITIVNGVKLEYNGSPDNPLAPVYVTGIANITEKQHGALSGWLYTVNGVSPDISCSEYPLEDGDIVEWVYTLELGKDVDSDE